MEPDELLAAIRIVASGDALLSPKATGSLIAQSEPETLKFLTAREREVVTLVGEGMSNEAIGERLLCRR